MARIIYCGKLIEKGLTGRIKNTKISKIHTKERNKCEKDYTKHLF